MRIGFGGSCCNTPPPLVIIMISAMIIAAFFVEHEVAEEIVGYGNIAMGLSALGVPLGTFAIPAIFGNVFGGLV